MSTVTFEVKGIAQVKGNARAFVPKKWADAAHAAGRAPRAIVTLDHTKAKGWEQLVAEQAQTVRDFFAGPVALAVTFYLPRPKTLPRYVSHHVRLPDLDKLLRCIGDALTGVLFDDDKQIVDVHARKVYAGADAAPHATITVRDAAPPEHVHPLLFDIDCEEAYGTTIKTPREEGPRQDDAQQAESAVVTRDGRPRDQTAGRRRGAVRRNPRSTHGADRGRTHAEGPRPEVDEEVREDDLPPQRRRDHRRAR
jgi:crossover junction endodeoxyribonuclease RusA